MNINILLSILIILVLGIIIYFVIIQKHNYKSKNEEVKTILSQINNPCKFSWKVKLGNSDLFPFDCTVSPKLNFGYYTIYLYPPNLSVILMFNTIDPEKLPEDEIRVTNICCNNDLCINNKVLPQGDQIILKKNGIGYYINQDESIILAPIINN